MRHDILVFDLDGTLCPVGRGMRPEDASLLCRLEEEGFTIVVCSGKPTYYLCGFLRQVGLRDPIMVGENGGTIQFGIGLPPRLSARHPGGTARQGDLQQLKREIDAVCGNLVWYQPAEMQLTPFPREIRAFAAIRDVLDRHPDLLQGLQVYEQIDCFDIVPEEINKGSGLAWLSQLLEAEPSRFLAVGDGVNDIPMFAFADLSILIQPENSQKDNIEQTGADLVLPDIHHALRYIWEHEK